MKRKVTKLLLTSLLVIGSAASVAPAISNTYAQTGPEHELIELQRNRLVQNGDFEKGSAGWTSLVNAEIANDSDSQVKGKFSGRINPTNHNNANGHIWQQVTLEAHTKYTLKAKVKIISTATNTPAVVIIKTGNINNPDKGNFKEKNIISTTDQWQDVEIPFDTDDKTNYIIGIDRWVEPVADQAAKDSSIYLDDVVLTKDNAVDQQETYDITWWDDFNGTSLNENKWDYELGHIRGIEQQHYVRDDKNVYVKDGQLTIKATDREKDSQYEINGRKVIYDSGSIRTHDNKEFLYGRLEIKAKLPKGQAVFPAFWTLGSDFTLDGVINGNQGHGWPSCGEVDIMELTGDGTDGSSKNRTVYQTLHYSPEGVNDDQGEFAANGTSYTLPSGNFNDEYHVFGLNWTKGKMEWYVDDQIVRTVDYSGDQNAVNALDKPQYIQLNLAMGGQWPGEVGTNLAGTTYDVDYVYYGQSDQQKADAAEYYATAPKLSGTQNITMQQGDIPDLLAGVSASNGYHVDYSIDDDAFFDNNAGNSKVNLVINSVANKAKLATLVPGKYTLYYTAIPDNQSVTPRQYTRDTVTLTVEPRTFPSDIQLSGVYGEKLSTVSLPENWSWDQPDTILSDPNAQYTVNFSLNGYTTNQNISVQLLSADKTNLTKAISDAKTYLKTDVYTADTLAALNTAIESAQKVINKTNATAVDITNAIEGLNTAITGLEKIPSVTPPVPDDDQYTITEGKEATVTQGKEITFKSNASFDKFKEVLLDGKVLDKAYYTVKEGSTIVTLNAEYTKLLASGKHTLTIVSTDGQASTSFTVEKTSTPVTPTDPTKPADPTVKPTDPTKPLQPTPVTGDQSQIVLWSSILAIGGFVFFKLRKKEN